MWPFLAGKFYCVDYVSKESGYSNDSNYLMLFEEFGSKLYWTDLALYSPYAVEGIDSTAKLAYSKMLIENDCIGFVPWSEFMTYIKCFETDQASGWIACTSKKELRINNPFRKGIKIPFNELEIAINYLAQGDNILAVYVKDDKYINNLKKIFPECEEITKKIFLKIC